jgi:hypothetical protein
MRTTLLSVVVGTMCFLGAVSVGCGQGMSPCSERCDEGPLEGSHGVASVDGDLAALGIATIDKVEVLDEGFQPGDTGSSEQMLIHYTTVDGIEAIDTFTLIAVTSF